MFGSQFQIQKVFRGNNFSSSKEIFENGNSNHPRKTVPKVLSNISKLKMVNNLGSPKYRQETGKLFKANYRDTPTSKSGMKAKKLKKNNITTLIDQNKKTLENSSGCKMPRTRLRLPQSTKHIDRKTNFFQDNVNNGSSKNRIDAQDPQSTNNFLSFHPNYNQISFNVYGSNNKGTYPQNSNGKSKHGFFNKNTAKGNF